MEKIKRRALIKASKKLRRAFSISSPEPLQGKSKVDEEVLDNLEEVLVSSDVGVATTLKIIERIEARVAKDKYLNTSELHSILKEEIVALLEKNQNDSESDF